jgi:serine/threonine-protein kinase HipA
VAASLGDSADVHSLTRLLQATVVNVLCGNGDAHAKNLSLLHQGNGRVTLAPLYDLLNTVVYGDDTLAMYVDDVRRLDRVTRERLLNEATSWGISVAAAKETIEDLLHRAPDAADRAQRQTSEVAPGVVDFVQEAIRRLRSDA